MTDTQAVTEAAIENVLAAVDRQAELDEGTATAAAEQIIGGAVFTA